MKKKKKTVVEASVVRDMANKNLNQKELKTCEKVYVLTVCCFFISVITIIWNLMVLVCEDNGNGNGFELCEEIS